MNEVKVSKKGCEFGVPNAALSSPPPPQKLKSVRVHFAYGSDGRSFFVEYS